MMTKEKGIVVQACTKVQCTTSSGIVPVPGATTTIFLENNMFCYGIYVIVELHTVEVWMKCTKSEKSMFYSRAVCAIKVVGLILIKRVRHEFLKHARKTQQGSVIHDPFCIIEKIYF